MSILSNSTILTREYFQCRHNRSNSRVWSHHNSKICSLCHTEPDNHLQHKNWSSKAGLAVVVRWVKLPLPKLTSLRDIIWSGSWYNSIQLSAGKAVESGPRALFPVTYTGHPDETPESCLQLGWAPAIATIWRSKPTGGFSLFLSVWVCACACVSPSSGTIPLKSTLNLNKARGYTLEIIASETIIQSVTAHIVVHLNPQLHIRILQYFS